MEKDGILITNLSAGYGENSLYNAFDLHFLPRQIVTILGPSGCGKTTLLNIISGITPFQKGVIAGGEHHQFGYVFQEPRLVPWLTVDQNLTFALSRIPETTHSAVRKHLILETLGLEDKRQRYPHQLSGGEQQRVALARAFLMPSDGLLMDEAFKGLDLLTKTATIDAFIALWQLEPKTVIAVSHDIHEAVVISDRVLIFSNSPVTVTTDMTLSPAEARSKDVAIHNRLIEKLKQKMGKSTLD